MRSIIRVLVYTFISLYFADLAVGSFSYTNDRTAYLVILAISLLYLLLKPVLSVVSLPTKGSVFLLITIITTFIIFYALQSVLPDFSFLPVTLRSLNIFGRVLPSKDLNSLWAMVFSALMTSAIYLFLESLSKRR
jgi:hypothetical protein